MSPTTIKELDGLPQGEIRELIKDGDRAVADDARAAREQIVKTLGGEVRVLSERMAKVETELDQVKALALEARDISQRTLDSVYELTKQLGGIQHEVHETQQETAEGVKVVTKVTRWKDTAQDFHLDRLLKWLVGIAGTWGAAKLAGWLAGPTIKEAILHRIF